MADASNAYGIERINVYPTRLSLDLEQLAEARGYDREHLRGQLMVRQRGLNPPWEDTVTMAVNAAGPLLSDQDRASIGLLIVATETGLDNEKAVSSWVLHFLGLPNACRHFELKVACYAGTAAVKMALAWLMSGMARPGEKALVVTSDESLNAIGKPWEYIGGGGAVALLLSGRPDVAAFETDKFGLYAQEVADVIRPLPWLETGNSEHSLFSYMEALGETYADFQARTGLADFEGDFQANLYHVPFSGISYRAHRQLLRMAGDPTDAEVADSFRRKVLPSLSYTSRIGGTYAGSVFVAMLGAIDMMDLVSGNRIGVFSYGAGSCAEFYAVAVTERSKARAAAAEMSRQLDERMPVTVQQYEAVERAREVRLRSADFTPDLGIVAGLYESHYRGQHLLVLDRVKEHYRHYAFS